MAEAAPLHPALNGGFSQIVQEIAGQLEAASARSYVSGVDIAAVYCGLNQPGSAMQWLNRAYAKRDKGMDMLAVEPLFDGCREDARFQDLLRKLKLKP